jgi:hypothetical protein
MLTIETLECKILLYKKGINSLPNLIKIYQEAKKLLVGHTQTDRQTGDLINLLLLLERRLKIKASLIHDVKSLGMSLYEVERVIA